MCMQILARTRWILGRTELQVNYDTKALGYLWACHSGTIEPAPKLHAFINRTAGQYRGRDGGNTDLVMVNLPASLSVDQVRDS